MLSAQPLTRSDLLLLLRPVNSVVLSDRRFVHQARLWGLIGALLFFAAIQIPAWVSYLRPNLRDNSETAKPSEAQLLAKTVEDSAQAAVTNVPEERSLLSYERLAISAPITWQVEYKNKEIQRHLENGLVHIKDAAEPGQQGTVILTGHSSNYVWSKGDYKTVFAALLQAQVGDTINLKHRGILYTYEVKDVYEVTPDRIDLMNAKSTVDLRLITCTPLGSTKKRLIVDAVQTTPDRTKNSEFSGGLIKAESLPKVR
ncbi:MAG: sortase [bacterium]|nr:sortase [bacterium]